MTRIGFAAALGYIATIIAANWMIVHVGMVHSAFWFGPMAPAGVYAAGFAFTFRDVVQHTLGREAAIVAIVAGGAFSYFVSPTFAVWSSIAFLVSELLDMAVFTPLEGKTFVGAVVASNTVGLAADSVIFLLGAFGSLEFLPGQIVGKILMTALAVPLVITVRRRVAVLPRYA